MFDHTCGADGARRLGTLTPDEVLVPDADELPAREPAPVVAAAATAPRRDGRMGWTVAAAVTAAALGSVLLLGMSVSRAAAHAQAQQALAIAAREEARRLQDRLVVIQREHAVAEHRAESAETEAERLRAQMHEQMQEITLLRAQKHQADQALQAALVSLYGRSGNGPATAAVPTD